MCIYTDISIYIYMYIYIHERVQLVGTWMFDELCLFVSSFFGLGLGDGRVRSIWLLVRILHGAIQKSRIVDIRSCRIHLINSRSLS